MILIEYIPKEKSIKLLNVSEIAFNGFYENISEIFVIHDILASLLSLANIMQRFQPRSKLIVFPHRQNLCKPTASMKLLTFAWYKLFLDKLS